jgi:hypothetical protein
MKYLFLCEPKSISKPRQDQVSDLISVEPPDMLDDRGVDSRIVVFSR